MTARIDPSLPEREQPADAETRAPVPPGPSPGFDPAAAANSRKADGAKGQDFCDRLVSGLKNGDPAATTIACTVRNLLHPGNGRSVLVDDYYMLAITLDLSPWDMERLYQLVAPAAEGADAPIASDFGSMEEMERFKVALEAETPLGQIVAMSAYLRSDTA